ncbi:MAG: hypothetical protein AAF799_32765 [Myxococcota bacterium]
MKTIAHCLLAALPTLALPACNQSDPGSESADTGNADGATDSEPAMLEGDYFPLVDGATWTYRHVASDGTTWDEIVQMRQVTFDGAAAFEIEDNAGNNGENTISTLVDMGGQVMRVHKEVLLAGTQVMTVDYAPGFLRFNNGWSSDERTDWFYDRTEYDDMAAVTDQAERHQIFQLESLSTEVTVPAGTFDCVQFLRTRGDTGESKRFWFAEGIGKIKHETLSTGSVEELAEYQIP